LLNQKNNRISQPHIDLLASYPTFQKSVKGLFLNVYHHIYSQQIYFRLHSSASELNTAISQAFDQVCHKGILFKLRKFLPSLLFLLIKSYLTNRYFQIRCGSSTSIIAPITAGVPQGSILSLILFNIYTSDQPTTSNNTIADYANDKVIFSVHNDPNIASTNLQSHLNLQSEWYKKWPYNFYS
jgi:hypothetical protein